ncbi:ANR family transcriptional regulator [Xenorhabdus bovienii]
MKNETYLDFANTAIQMEKEEKYDLAALYWGRAKYLAADLKHRLWA